MTKQPDSAANTPSEDDSTPLDALTRSQRKFVLTYFSNGGNGTRAALAAYNVSNPNSAAAMACEVLRSPKVAAAMKWLMSSHVMSPEEASWRLAQQARADISDYLVPSEYGQPTLDWEALKEAGLGHLIKEIKQTPNGTTFKLVDSQVALDRVMRANGQYVDRHEHSGPGGKPIEVTDPVGGVMRRMFGHSDADFKDEGET